MFIDLSFIFTMPVSAEAKNVVMKSTRVVFVPYKRIHVGKYHQWMMRPELQYLTGSEPLTLEEEYAMQEKWVNDPDKITFILLDRQMFESSEGREEDEVQSMIGDTNIYFPNPDDLSEGEMELMIAEETYRGRGIGGEVLSHMMFFAKESLGVQKLFAKIKVNNYASIHLFEKYGFHEVSHSEVFQEKTFERIL